MIWQPYTKTSGHYLASKILQGFFGAPIESLCEISITDIWFQHERGKYLALFGFLLAGSNYLAPFLMGFILQGQGWQWVFYWCAIFCGIALIFNFFFMEETNWSKSKFMWEPKHKTMLKVGSRSRDRSSSNFSKRTAQ